MYKDSSKCFCKQSSGLLQQPAIWIAQEPSIQTIERVQNAAARLICNVGRFEHITPSLYMLHRLPVNYRIQFKILLFVYKALNGIAPPYISELVELKPASRYNLRNSDDTLLLNSPSFKSRIT